MKLGETVAFARKNIGDRGRLTRNGIFVNPMPRTSTGGRAASAKETIGLPLIAGANDVGTMPPRAPAYIRGAHHACLGRGSLSGALSERAV